MFRSRVTVRVAVVLFCRLRCGFPTISARLADAGARRRRVRIVRRHDRGLEKELGENVWLTAFAEDSLTPC
jgi:hypothetical protein